MPNMSKGEDEILSSYSSLSEAIRFFLYESFRHIENEMRYHIAGEIYGKKLNDINTTDEDHAVVKGLQGILDSPLDLINFTGDPLSEKTLTKLTIAWKEAQSEAELHDMTFPVTKELNGRDLLGHITNFAFVIEILTNRHLLIMNLKKEIDDFTFNSLDKASVLNKVLYLFKTEIKEKKLNPDRISSLFKLRNLAVHFTRDNSQRFRTTIQELIAIWKDSIRLMELFEQKENINDNDFLSHMNDLKENFVRRFTQTQGASR